jgi:hypothetical protein
LISLNLQLLGKGRRDQKRPKKALTQKGNQLVLPESELQAPKKGRGNQVCRLKKEINLKIKAALKVYLEGVKSKRIGKKCLNRYSSKMTCMPLIRKIKWANKIPNSGSAHKPSLNQTKQ